MMRFGDGSNGRECKHWLRIRVLKYRTRVGFSQLDNSDMPKEHIKTNMQPTNQNNFSLLFSSDYCIVEQRVRHSL